MAPELHRALHFPNIEYPILYFQRTLIFFVHIRADGLSEHENLVKKIRFGLHKKQKSVALSRH